MDRWQNRVAVVSGASSGIGAAIARQLAEKGMIVVGLARRVERVQALRDELEPESGARLHAMSCDVRDEEEVVRTFSEIVEKFGPVSVMVCNAGVVRPSGLLHEGNTEDMRSIMETNVLGVAWCTREAFKSMKSNGIDGHVVLINSIAGHNPICMGKAAMNLYPPSKYAVTSMTELYRNEFRDANTKCKITSISPGLVDTEIFTDDMRSFLEAMPILKSDDVADAVVYCIQTPPHVQIHELTIKPVGEVM